MGFVAVLEGVDQVAAGTLIGKGRPGGIKTGRQGGAAAADMIRTGTGKGDAANDAQRRRYRRHQLTADRTDMELTG